MSATNLEQRPNAGGADSEVRTYRGRTLDEILPKIRAELGPDAVVVRQRDGLMGGVGGFFQQKFVEVEARRGRSRMLDTYDEPAAPSAAAQAAPVPGFPQAPPVPGFAPAAAPAPGFAPAPQAAPVPARTGGAAYPPLPGGGAVAPAPDAILPRTPAEILREHSAEFARTLAAAEERAAVEAIAAPPTPVHYEPPVAPARPAPAPAPAAEPVAEPAPRTFAEPARAQSAPAPRIARGTFAEPASARTAPSRRVEHSAFAEPAPARAQSAPAASNAAGPDLVALVRGAAPAPAAAPSAPSARRGRGAKRRSKPRTAAQPATPAEPLVTKVDESITPAMLRALVTGEPAPTVTATDTRTTARAAAPEPAGIDLDDLAPVPVAVGAASATADEHFDLDSPTGLRSGEDEDAPASSAAADAIDLDEADAIDLGEANTDDFDVTDADELDLDDADAADPALAPAHAASNADTAQAAAAAGTIPAVSVAATMASTATAKAAARKPAPGAARPARRTRRGIFSRKAHDPRPGAAIDRQATAAAGSALVGRGISSGVAEAVLADATAHILPFTPDVDVRVAARTALARRIPIPAPPAAGGRAVAFVGAGGSGKTRCVAGLAAAYANASALPVAVLTLTGADGAAELNALLEPYGVLVEAVKNAKAAAKRVAELRDTTLVVLDTPGVSPGDDTAIAKLADQLAPLGLDETQLVIPATLSAHAAQELLERLAPLQPSGIAMTHADATGHVGAIVELACATRTPLAYVNEGLALPGALRPADPAELAERMLT